MHCSILRIPKEEDTRGCSSAGRAPALQAGGQEFDPPHLHREEEKKHWMRAHSSGG